jgi:hypothetical protein
MVAIPVLNGIYGNEAANFAHSYPKNLEPTSIDTKLSKGYLRAPMGCRSLTTGPGIDRAGINWNETCWRVMGDKLVRLVNDVAVVRGTVGGSGYAALGYSFDRLACVSDGKLYYDDGTTFSQVTDTDVGTVLDLIWVDGYFMLTDGRYIIVTELSDPTQVSPLKYGSAEDDPDNITGLLKVRDEVQVLGRYTIQPFQDVGGVGFPFAAIRGATIPKGCVAPSAKCLFGETFAFVGSGRNEELGVFVAGSGTAQKISDRHIDQQLAAVTDVSKIVLEQRVSGDERRLYVHLPETTWVFLANVSNATGETVWYEASSGAGDPYRIRNVVVVGSKAYCGDVGSAAIGVIDTTTMDHFGARTEWRFDVGLIYNEAKGGIVHELELIGLPGRGEADDNPVAFLSMSRDAGETWSQERAVSLGKHGDRAKRIRWPLHSHFRQYCSFRIRSLSSALPGYAALEADIEPLNV